MDGQHLLPALITAGIVYWLYEHPSSQQQRNQPISSTPSRLKEDLEGLVEKYYNTYIYPHQYPSISFVIPSTRSVTDNHSTVHVLVHDPVTGDEFDYNTLLQVGAHECAHALCHSDEGGDHGPAFAAVLDKLDKIGVEEGLYDPSIPIPARYKQLC